MIRNVMTLTTVGALIIGTSSSGLQLPNLIPRRHRSEVDSRAAQTQSQVQDEHDEIPVLPEIAMPDVINGSIDTFIKIEAKTNGKNVEFFAIDDGLAVFPSKMLLSTKSTVVFPKSAKDFRLAAYTSLNDELSEPKIVIVRVTGPEPVIPTPPPKPVIPEPVIPEPVIPIPPPKPVIPEPVVPAPLPEGKFGLATPTRDIIIAGIPVTKRGTAKLIAGNYGVVSAQIAAGTIKTLAEAASTIKTMNRASVNPADVSLWTPVFIKLNAKVNGLGITSITDWQEAFSELGQGFSAAGGE